MQALIHIEPKSKKVIGVWIYKGGRPQSYYDEQAGGTAFQRQLGASTMRRRVRGNWAAWCEHLTKQQPVDVWWECSEFPAEMSPKEIFNSVIS